MKNIVSINHLIPGDFKNKNEVSNIQLMDDFNNNYLKDAKKETCIQKFNHFCPP